MNERMVKTMARLKAAEDEAKLAYAKGQQDAANKLRGIMPAALESAFDEGVKSLAEFVRDTWPAGCGAYEEMHKVKLLDAIKSLIYGKKLKDIEDQFERRSNSSGGPSAETTDSAPGAGAQQPDDQPWLRVRGLHDPVPGDQA